MIHQQITDLFYKWDEFEKSNGIDIIDFDLIGNRSAVESSFFTRDEILDEIDYLIERVKASAVAYENFILKKLEASRTLIEYLNGENIDYTDYVKRTLGIEPGYIDESEIEVFIKQLRNYLNEAGFDYTKVEWERYKAERRIGDKAQTKKYMRSKADEFMPKIIEWLQLDIKPDYKLEFVEEDVYWHNWISTNRKGRIILKFNMHPRHYNSLGAIEYLVLHEVCAHVLQVESWRQQIKSGQIPESLGLLTVFSPEQFTLEGMAESLYYFLPFDPFSIEGKIHLAYDSLNWTVLNNATLLFVEKGEQASRKFIKKTNILADINYLIKDIKQRLEDPVLRAYTYVYGYTLYKHWLISKKFDSEAKQKFVKGMYTNIYLPEEINDLTSK